MILVAIVMDICYNDNMKIGIFGGTFDPPHKVHVAIVGQAIAELSLDKVIVFPCGMPPHKHSYTDKMHRASMTKLAFAKLPVEVDCFELDKEGKSYTVDTVKYLLGKYPDAHITLIIGGDSYMQLDQWYCYKQLLSMVDIAVAVRSGSSIDEGKYHCNTHVLQLGNVDVSSTDIRLRCQYGLPIRALVKKSVVQYIVDNQLYSSYRHITRQLEGMINNKRYMHSFMVTATALALSGGKCYDEVFIASTLHDCAKSCYVDYLHMTKENSDIAHAHIGAIVAKEKFGIDNEQILDAIYWHTTARANMSWLEKIVFLADKLEPTRDYDTASLYRETLDETLLATLNDLVYFLELMGKEVHHLTKEAVIYYNDIINKGNG